MNTYRRFLKDDLLKIKQVYNESRENFTIVQDKIERENNSWKAEIKRGWSSQADKERDAALHNEKLRNLKGQLSEVIAKAKENFETVKEDSCKEFDRYFRATPEQIDNNTIELLKSGVLTIDEMKSLLNEFADNVTMRRVIGKYLEESAEANKDRNTVVFAKILQQVQTPHRNAFDSLITWSEAGLREDRALSDGIHRCYETEANKIIAKYESLSIPAEIPRAKE